MSNLGALALALPMVTAAEGCVLTAYLDTIARPPVWTIGHGTTHVKGAPVHENMVCSKAQADAWAEADMAATETAIGHLCHITLSDHQLAACISFAYNCGLGTFSRSSVLEAINFGFLTLAANRFLNYANAGGKPNHGLMLRRERERACFLTGMAPTTAIRQPTPTQIDEADALNGAELDQLNPKPA